MIQSRKSFKPELWLRYAALILGLACCAGCPDYSHLRPAPDYSNMTDSGGDSGGSEAETVRE